MEKVALDVIVKEVEGYIENDTTRLVGQGSAPDRPQLRRFIFDRNEPGLQHFHGQLPKQIGEASSNTA